jgi:hypothetical protein
MFKVDLLPRPHYAPGTFQLRRHSPFRLGQVQMVADVAIVTIVPAHRIRSAPVM